MLGKKLPEKLYHGTCRAFVAFALQNDDMFGPAYDSVSFTPQYEHAKMFAESWSTERGMERLREFFGYLDECLAEPVVLEFPSTSLGDLGYREDCGAEEYFMENGPVMLTEAREVPFKGK